MLGRVARRALSISPFSSIAAARRICQVVERPAPTTLRRPKRTTARADTVCAVAIRAGTITSTATSFFTSGCLT